MTNQPWDFEDESAVGVQRRYQPPGVIDLPVPWADQAAEENAWYRSFLAHPSNQ